MTDVDITNADEHFIDPPRDLKEQIYDSEALSATNLFIRNNGDDRRYVFPDHFNNRPSAKAILGLVMTWLDMNDKVLSPDGLHPEKHLTKRPDRVDSKLVLAKKIQKFLARDDQIVTGEGEFIDKERVRITEPKGNSATSETDQGEPKEEG